SESTCERSIFMRKTGGQQLQDGLGKTQRTFIPRTSGALCITSDLSRTTAGVSRSYGIGTRSRVLSASRALVGEAVRTSPERALLRRDQAIQCDREFAHANACSVPNSIGHCACGAGDPDLSHALDAERVDVRIPFLDQDRFER